MQRTNSPDPPSANSSIKRKNPQCDCAESARTTTPSTRNDSQSSLEATPVEAVVQTNLQVLRHDNDVTLPPSPPLPGTTLAIVAVPVATTARYDVGFTTPLSSPSTSAPADREVVHSNATIEEHARAMFLRLVPRIPVEQLHAMLDDVASQSQQSHPAPPNSSNIVTSTPDSHVSSRYSGVGTYDYAIPPYFGSLSDMLEDPNYPVGSGSGHRLASTSSEPPVLPSQIDLLMNPNFLLASGHRNTLNDFFVSEFTSNQHLSDGHQDAVIPCWGEYDTNALSWRQVPSSVPRSRGAQDTACERSASPRASTSNVPSSTLSLTRHRSSPYPARSSYDAGSSSPNDGPAERGYLGFAQNQQAYSFMEFDVYPVGMVSGSAPSLPHGDSHNAFSGNIFDARDALVSHSSEIKGKEPARSKQRKPRQCANRDCRTTQSPIWRTNPYNTAQRFCNACGQRIRAQYKREREDSSGGEGSNV
ncbi:hypothetical protein R3P38DRAFT_1121131 [Favolaschia claudopus]|uniref:GATA-type domain-containing protein n=1 Tax=Favolaschia claudopus TaxID=2862362 RepID=A0AAW0B9A0_9AGAR